MGERSAGLDDGYWDKELEDSQAKINGKMAATLEDNALFFWGMCLFVALSILFGPTVLLSIGMLK